MENNEREWFWSHEVLESLKSSECRNDTVRPNVILKRSSSPIDIAYTRFIEALSAKLMEVDASIPPLPVKDIVPSPRGGP